MGARRETPLWRRYLRFLGADPAGDVDDELAFHITMRVDELKRSGVPEAEARRRAEREFGDVEAIRGELNDIGRERVRRERRARAWESLAQDVRFAVRTLRSRPGFTAVAVLTLALGIAASTATFTVLNGVLLRGLPVEAQDELAVLWLRTPDRGADHLPVFHRDLAAYREQTRAFRGVAGVAYQGVLEQVVRDRGEALTLGATWVTGDLFPLLGVRPHLGRTLLPSDDVPGADRVMVIGHAFWQRHFGASPAAVGHVLEWNGERHTVVGVLPRGFDYPQGAEAWFPVIPAFPGTLQPGAPPQEVMVFDLVGRLAPAATAREGREDFAAFLRATDDERPAPLRGAEPVVTPLHERVVGDVRPTLWAAAAAVGLLLLIACVNVANLLLIRGSARTREFAVRVALGAGKRRLVRQLLTESVVLAMLGGVLGAVLAAGAVRVLVAMAPAGLPGRDAIQVDARVLAFAVGVTAAAALLAGLLPALVTAAGSPGAWLRGGGREASAARGVRTLRHALVAGQIALAVVVVAGAGLLTRSLLALQGVDLGFERERLLVVEAAFPPDPAPERAARVALQEEMVAAVAALPEVASAASLPRPPFSAQGGWTAAYTAEGQTPEAQAANPWVNFEVVGPGYFRTLGIPLLRGRGFEAADREDAPPVAVVSEAVARHTWPGEDPLGRRLRLGGAGQPGEWHTVVGVVGETRYRELEVPQPTLYLPVRQFGGPVPASLAVRTRAGPAAVVPRIREALAGVHPELALVGGGSMEQLLAAPLARPRFGALLLGAFAAATLLLAAVGLYGAVAAVVRLRTREIGVRLAVGARAGQVRALVMRQGMGVALLGCALGVAAALPGTRALRGMLFGVEPTDPATYATIVVIALATAAAACWIPARRAARVDPAEALRSE